MIFNKEENTWKENNGFWTSKEIYQQPSTWTKTLVQVRNEAAALKAFIDRTISQPDYDIILTGAGTSEFVGNALYSYLNRFTNYKVKSYASTDIVATPENYLSRNKPTLLVSFARSGNSPESVASVELANQVCGKNVNHLFVTCNVNGALSKFAEGKENCYALDLTPETHDQSFAMTSSFSNMYLATALAFTLEKVDKIDDKVSMIIRQTQEFLDEGYRITEKIINDFDFKRIVYLGSNSLKGVSQESALKMCELTAGKIVTMFDTTMGFRHGPKSIIDPTTLIIVYLSDDPYTRQYDIDIIKEMSPERNGNKILAVSSYVDEEVQELVDYFISFDNEKTVDSVLLGIEYITVAQMIALNKSLSYGITPDNPCPTGEVNRVVKGVTIHPYNK